MLNFNANAQINQSIPGKVSDSRRRKEQGSNFKRVSKVKSKPSGNSGICIWFLPSDREKRKKEKSVKEFLLRKQKFVTRKDQSRD